MLEIHFLRVAHGDCTIIRAHGRVTMIDINTEKPPGVESDALDYLDAHFPGQSLHRYIQAHLEPDHMRGLARLLAHRRVRYAWIPVENDNHMLHPNAAELDDCAGYHRLRRGLQADTTTINPMAGRACEALDRFDLEGWSIVMPDETVAGYARYGEFAPPSYIMALDYAGVRVILGGEVRRALWQRAVRDRALDLPCAVLRASHPLRTPEIGYNALPHNPALDLMRPAQVVLTADPACRAEVEQAYRSRGAEIIWLDQAAAVVLAVQPDGARQFSITPIA